MGRPFFGARSWLDAIRHHGFLVKLGKPGPALPDLAGRPPSRRQQPLQQKPRLNHAKEIDEAKARTARERMRRN